MPLVAPPPKNSSLSPRFDSFELCDRPWMLDMAEGGREGGREGGELLQCRRQASGALVDREARERSGRE